MEEQKRNIEHGTFLRESNYRIVIDAEGPILVYGNPPLKHLVIMPNKDNISSSYKTGKIHTLMASPTALCRCGKSEMKPYCDESHLKGRQNLELTADNKPMFKSARFYDGKSLTLEDNKDLCAYARFCDTHINVWNMVRKESGKVDELNIIKQEVANCPSGRLRLWNRIDNTLVEDKTPQELNLIEDPVMECSGPLWVRGAIKIDSSEGTKYELRNRVTLCRCGASSNKPFCDGAHASVRFDDGNIDS
ncbi:MAG: CDGSH iron-sulfur domain-containing protein [Rikenellaceae bacterium]